jgi:flavin reductase (DIM6/NTAB) family NADH-FMN oxidoreductase RutF
MEKQITTALKKFEYGIYIVTMGKGTEGNAFTASWVAQVSSEPPMVALAVHNKHQSSRLIDQHGGFVINLIAENHPEIAKAYYGPAESGYQKLAHADVGTSPATGSPLILGSLGFLDCMVVSKVSAGNHTLFIGEVKAAQLHQDTSVLTTSKSKLHYLG